MLNCASQALQLQQLQASISVRSHKAAAAAGDSAHRRLAAAVAHVRHAAGVDVDLAPASHRHIVGGYIYMYVQQQSARHTSP
jgi:hypothetical protein